MHTHHSFEGKFEHDTMHQNEYHIQLDSAVLEKYQAEFGEIFSMRALSLLTEGDELLMQDVDTLITRSHIYAGEVLLLQELADVKDGSVEGMRGLLDRQEEAHTQFIDALTTLYTHAVEKGKQIPFEIQEISRVRSIQIALFIAYEDENRTIIHPLSKSA
ncbi:MAG: hypothetical protein WC099_00700 [Candidatus Paceibacterota bacterium]